MNLRMLWTGLLFAAVTLGSGLPNEAQAERNDPPEGFVALFNGKDLAGWHGQDHFDPRKLKAMSEDERTEKLKKDNENLKQHWSVKDGEIVNDGQGVYLTTDHEYGDFELCLDWKMTQPNGDSGIYLRGSPQVQIWDPKNEKAHRLGAQHGSGALWNNNPESEGRFPLVKADKPIGEWNTFRIRMVGDRVTVHFNDELVVDNAVMHNYFERKEPMFDRGVIQLQTHGSDMRFRNVFLRKIPREEESAGTAEK